MRVRERGRERERRERKRGERVRERERPRGILSIALTISLLTKNRAVCRAASPMCEMYLRSEMTLTHTPTYTLIHTHIRTRTFKPVPFQASQGRDRFDFAHVQIRCNPQRGRREGEGGRGVCVCGRSSLPPSHHRIFMRLRCVIILILSLLLLLLLFRPPSLLFLVFFASLLRHVNAIAAVCVAVAPPPVRVN